MNQLYIYFEIHFEIGLIKEDASSCLGYRKIFQWCTLFIRINQIVLGFSNFKASLTGSILGLLKCKPNCILDQYFKRILGITGTMKLIILKNQTRSFMLGNRPC